jgi:hypothetical protein
VDWRRGRRHELAQSREDWTNGADLANVANVDPAGVSNTFNNGTVIAPAEPAR